MTDRGQSVDDIFEICRRVCLHLWNLCNENSEPAALTPHLIFPKRRDGTIRISEQEARLLCCDLLNSSNYYYSVETPTKEKYGKGRSALTDVTLHTFDGNSFQRAISIEFKPPNCTQEEIRKDLEKLVREQILGNWFHTLKNANRGTFRRLFQKFAFAFCEHASYFSDMKISVVFCFCVLEKGTAYMKSFNYEPKTYKYEDYVTKFFDPSAIDDKWEIISQRAVAIKVTKQQDSRHSQLVESASEQPIWERTGSSLKNRLNLKASNWLNLNIELFRGLLRKVKDHDPDVNRPFSSKASQEFYKWFEAPNRPLAEAAYALLSNWFLGSGAWYKGKSRAKAAGNLWDALFCARPAERLTDPRRDDKILQTRFESWWPKQLDCQDK